MHCVFTPPAHADTANTSPRGVPYTTCTQRDKVASSSVVIRTDAFLVCMCVRACVRACVRMQVGLLCTELRSRITSVVRASTAVAAAGALEPVRQLALTLVVETETEAAPLTARTAKMRGVESGVPHRISAPATTAGPATPACGPHASGQDFNARAWVHPYGTWP
jgi:hypothetical protein